MRLTWLLPVLLVTAGCRTGSSVVPANPPPHLAGVRRAWQVMGTMLVVTAYGPDSSALLAAMMSARDSVRLVDSLMSIFRPTSEISAINRGAGTSAVPVSPQTRLVLRQARLYWALSNRTFDPTIGPLSKAWRSALQDGRLPSAAMIDSLRALVGFERVEIDDDAGTVKLPQQGMELDLGGVAKGHALDMARAAFRGSSATGGSIDLGGNILFFGSAPTGTAWQVGIVDPAHRDRTIVVLALDSGAIATSGDAELGAVIGGVRYSHIIDPRSGYPVRNGVASATAIGPSGLWSDGMSATLLMSGPVRGAALIDSIGAGMGAVFVTSAGQVTRSGLAVMRGRER